MKAWAIKHWRCGLYIETVRRTRIEAIDSFKQQFGIDEATWLIDRRFRVHKPVVVEVLAVTTAPPKPRRLAKRAKRRARR